MAAKAGVDVEIGPLELEAILKLGDRLDDYLTRIDRAEARKKEAKAQRLFGDVKTTAGFSGSGPIAIYIEKPPAGHIFIVQWVTAWVGVSVAAGTTANLNMAVMSGQCPVGPSGFVGRAVPVNVSDLIIPTQAVPNPPTGTPDGAIVKPDQQLYVLLGGSGLAASTQYNAAAGVFVVPDIPEALFW